MNLQTALGESLVQKRKVKRSTCSSYRSQKLQKLQQSVSKSLQLFNANVSQPVDDANEIIQQLK